MKTMKIMALTEPNTTVKFVKTPTSHLFCAICEKVYTDPVINIACGHSFCRQCLTLRLSDDQTFKCPIDSATSVFHNNNLVLNRSLEDQINDLDVYCSFGWKWSEEAKDLVQDPDGCQEIIKHGLRLNHEARCGFARVICPWGGEKCGILRQKEMDEHQAVCCFHQCTNSHECCQFSNNAEKQTLQRAPCSCTNRKTVTIDILRFNELLMSQQRLELQLKETRERTQMLESVRTVLEDQVKGCLNKILELTQKQVKMEETLQQLTSGCGAGMAHGSIQRVPSLPNNSISRSSVSASHDAFSPSWARRSMPCSFGDSSRPKTESWMMPFQFKCIGTLRSHSSGVCCLRTWKNKLFSCGADCVIKVWDLENLVQGCKMTITGHTQRIQTMTVGSHFLYSAGEDLMIKSYHLDTLKEHISVQNAHEKCVTAMLCTQDFLFSSSYTVIKIWDCHSLSLVHTISGLHHWVRALACGTNNDKVYSGSHGNIDIWKPIPDFSLTAKITHCHGSVHALAVTSLYIIIGTYNRNMHIYDVKTNAQVHSLTGHVGVINSLVTSISGMYMFTGSSDSSVQVWSLEKMLPIQTLQRHNDSVNALIIDGDLLLTGSEDAEIKVFKHFRMQMGFVPS